MDLDHVNCGDGHQAVEQQWSNRERVPVWGHLVNESSVDDDQSDREEVTGDHVTEFSQNGSHPTEPNSNQVKREMEGPEAYGFGP